MAEKAGIQKWGSYEPEAAAEEQAVLDEQGGGGFFKFAAGRNVLRFLPPPVGQRSPFVMTHQHYITPPGQQQAVSFNCPRVMGKRACFACAHADKLKATGNKADFDEAKQFFPKLRVYANVIARANPEAGPQVAAFGKMVHEALVALRADEDAGGDYTHPLDGFDIIVEKTGSGLDTKYKVLPARVTSELGDLEWISLQQNLQRFGTVPEDDEIIEKLGPMASQMGIRGAPAGRGRQPGTIVTTGRTVGTAPRAAAPRAAATPRKPAARTAESDAMGEDD